MGKEGHPGLVAEFKRKKPPFLISETYEVLANGSLKIKKPMMRNDSGTYNVMVYGTNGMTRLEKDLDVRILGKSPFPKGFHFRTAAM